MPTAEKPQITLDKNALPRIGVVFGEPESKPRWEEIWDAGVHCFPGTYYEALSDPKFKGLSRAKQQEVYICCLSRAYLDRLQELRDSQAEAISWKIQAENYASQLPELEEPDDFWTSDFGGQKSEEGRA